jgi:hypothetical protein
MGQADASPVGAIANGAKGPGNAAGVARAGYPHVTLIPDAAADLDLMEIRRDWQSGARGSWRGGNPCAALENRSYQESCKRDRGKDERSEAHRTSLLVACNRRSSTYAHIKLRPFSVGCPLFLQPFVVMISGRVRSEPRAKPASLHQIYTLTTRKPRSSARSTRARSWPRFRMSPVAAITL